MAVIDFEPFIMRDCLFQVEADQYEAHVSQVQFDPTTNVVRFKGLTPTSNHAFNSASEWVANLAYAQDWSTPDSLSEYLHEHEGDLIDVIFEPVNGGRSITATLTVAPGSIGGPVDAVAVANVSLASTKPALGSITPVVPTVLSVTPSALAAAGGDMVKIVGTSFTGTTDVEFDGTPATEFVVESNNTIYAVAPAHAAGAAVVTVENGVGVSVSLTAVTYA